MIPKHFPTEEATVHTIRLLIVEDDRPVRIHLKKVLEERNLEAVLGRKNLRLAITLAGSAEEAERELTRAAANGQPFDVVLLDLGLPQTSAVQKDTAPEDAPPDVGLKILRELKPGACNAVVIASGYHVQSAVMIELIKLRKAFDFVPKPFERDREDVFRSVIKAFLAGQERLWVQRQRENDQRRWVEQARAEGANLVANAVQPSLDQLSVALEQFRMHPALKSEFSASLRRYADKLLDLTRQADERTADACFRATASSGDYGPCDLTNLVDAVLAEANPGLLCRRLTTTLEIEDGLSVHTFPSELQTVLREVLYRAIEHSPPDATLRVLGQRDETRKLLNLIVEDHAPTIAAEVRQAIDDGQPIGSEDSRDQGLALAEPRARKIGVSMEIAAPEQGGNRITLHIPVTPHDHTSRHRP